MGNWIQLASGGGYDFDKAIITGPFTVMADLAWPLSGLNRFVNHTTRQWDVAAHSVVVARTIEALRGDIDAAAAGLLHEAHESVIGDIPTPVAWHVGYDAIKQLKREVQEAIYWRLHTPQRKRTDNHHEDVELADHAALYVEKQLFMVPEPAAWSVAMPPHEWMLETHAQVHKLLRELKDKSSAQVFVEEYLRLVDEFKPPDVRVATNWNA